MSIDLKPLIDEDDKRFIKYVTFDGVSKDSYLRTHNREMHKRLQSRNYYNNEYKNFRIRHLLNICVRNTSYIYDLDESEKNKR